MNFKQLHVHLIIVAVLWFPLQIATLTVLQNNNPDVVNSIEHPKNISPQQSAIGIKGKKINLNYLPYSFSVIRLKME